MLHKPAKIELIYLIIYLFMAYIGILIEIDPNL